MYTIKYNLGLFSIEYYGGKFIFEKNTFHSINGKIFRFTQISAIYCLYVNDYPLYYFDNNANFEVEINDEYEIIDPNYNTILIYSDNRRIVQKNCTILKIGSILYYDGFEINPESVVLISHCGLCRQMCKLSATDNTMNIGDHVYKAADARIKLSIEDNNLQLRIKLLNKWYQRRVYVDDNTPK